MRVLILACVIGAAASPALAGDWRSWDSVWAQRDVPGDYRCDAYWDRGRTDCDARWRDQRRYATGGYDRHHRGHGHGHRHGQRYAYGYGHAPGYASGYGYGRAAPVPTHGYPAYGQPQAQVFHGAWGRPDLVYGGGGYAPAPIHSGGRDPARIDWCRRTYRSYDPHSGYYLAWSGRRVWCG